MKTGILIGASVVLIIVMGLWGYSCGKSTIPPPEVITRIDTVRVDSVAAVITPVYRTRIEVREVPGTTVETGASYGMVDTLLATIDSLVTVQYQWQDVVASCDTTVGAVTMQVAYGYADRMFAIDVQRIDVDTTRIEIQDNSFGLWKWIAAVAGGGLATLLLYIMGAQ